MSRDSVGHTLAVAGILCGVCSLLVSAAAVGLRPLQLRNKEEARQKNILELTGLYRDDLAVGEAFQQFDTKVVDLKTGKFVSVEQIDPTTYDQRRAAKDPELSEPVPSESDVAGIRRRERYSIVYFARKDDRVDQVVMPMYGSGLWSTMYGFLSLDADGTTIRGLTFYEHGETPGLGAEVDNPKWKKLWVGKRAFDEEGRLEIEVIKGTVDTKAEGAEFQVDGLSGATITAKGVTKMLQYWLGPDGYGPFLEQLKADGVLE